MALLVSFHRILETRWAFGVTGANASSDHWGTEKGTTHPLHSRSRPAPLLPLTSNAFSQLGYQRTKDALISLRWLPVLI